MDIWLLLSIGGMLAVVGFSIWHAVRDRSPSEVVAGLVSAIGVELLGLAAIIFFVGGALFVILLTGGGPAVGLIAVPIIVLVLGIILWRLRH